MASARFSGIIETCKEHIAPQRAQGRRKIQGIRRPWFVLIAGSEIFQKNILRVRFFRFIDISVLRVINDLIHTFPFSCGLFAAESVSEGKQVTPLESQEIFGGNVQFRA